MTKHIIAAVLVTSLKGAGYFPTEQPDDSADVLIGKLDEFFFSESSFTLSSLVAILNIKPFFCLDHMQGHKKHIKPTLQHANKLL